MNIYLVGGAVRDELLGRKVKERDYVVTGATPEDMTARGFKQVGKDFPVFLHPDSKEEYALARTERKQGQGYTGFICDFAPDITLEQDLLRRDLTVNAIAKDAQGKLIDPYGGQADLNKRILRHVSGAFAEDPLRVLRVARFAARYAYLGFTVADETLTLMRNMVAAGELDTLTPERVWLEWNKSLDDGAFDVFLSVLKQVGALKVICDALDNACNEDYLRGLKQRLDFAASRNADTALKLVQVTAPLAESELDSFSLRLRLSNDIRYLLQRFHRYLPLFGDDIKAPQLLACFNETDLWRRPEHFSQLLEAVTIYRMGNINRKQLEQAARAASQVDARDCIAEGITGAAIKDAMAERRLTAIASSLGQ